ncbi:MAG: hypothetical protein A2W80_16735 [Candidatus Riflebacteria bacterium GWC2_50_8]|nr:MAG: hypothetical protein A2W80_16735 [Candidatus Riflebacteria bacterium GWC2_50_8]
MRSKYLFLVLAMLVCTLLTGRPGQAESYDPGETVDYSSPLIIRTRELVEQPLPHHRYSTIIFRGNTPNKGQIAKQPLAENPEPLHDQLLSTFYAKIESREYIDWSNLPGIPKGFQHFPEEADIKSIRARLAKKALPPDGTEVIVIPLCQNLAVTIDGHLDEPQWEQLAAKIMIGKDGARTLLYLLADDSNLYLGCDAIDERTMKGFDQFRFYFHLNTSPHIANERIHVSEDTVNGLRQTRINWRKSPPTNENERWKKFHISDWNIYQLASGTCSFSRNKKYEASINLEESGLPIEIPFSAFVEVESDPIYEAGKFKSRVHIGELGTQKRPVWFIIQKIAAEAQGR